MSEQTRQALAEQFEAWAISEGQAKRDEYDGFWLNFVVQRGAIFSAFKAGAALATPEGAAEPVALVSSVVGDGPNDVGIEWYDGIVSVGTKLYTHPAPATQATQDFEQWWERGGQFSRAGGDDYEKTFAFNAWKAATPAAPVVLTDESIASEAKAFVDQGYTEKFAFAFRVGAGWARYVLAGKAEQPPQPQAVQAEPVGIVRHENGRAFAVLVETYDLSKALPDGAHLYARPQPLQAPPEPAEGGL